MRSMTSRDRFHAIRTARPGAQRPRSLESQTVLDMSFAVLLGETRGPRLGSFIAISGLDATRKLIDTALAGSSFAKVRTRAAHFGARGFWERQRDTSAAAPPRSIAHGSSRLLKISLRGPAVNSSQRSRRVPRVARLPISDSGANLRQSLPLACLVVSARRRERRGQKQTPCSSFLGGAHGPG